MERQRRMPLEIMVEILSLCTKPQTKTHVMYSTNLSYRALQTYLHQLEASKLLEIHHSVTRYATTKKGLEFLDKWSELKRLLLPDGKRAHDPGVLLF